MAPMPLTWSVVVIADVFPINHDLLPCLVCSSRLWFLAHPQLLIILYLTWLWGFPLTSFRPPCFSSTLSLHLVAIVQVWNMVNMQAKKRTIPELYLSNNAEGQTTVTLWRRETRIDCLGLRRRSAARRHHRNRQLFSPRKRHGEAERGREGEEPFFAGGDARASGRLQTRTDA